MKIALGIGSVIIPLLMYCLQRIWLPLRIIFNVLAIICTLVFGNIAAMAIYSIIKNETVFMTDIHAIFLNPIFLITGAYVGMYVLYLLLFLTINNGN